MIVVSGLLTFSEDKLADARAALVGLRASTVAEDGCEEYAFWESLETPGEFRVFEEWRDADAMAGHMGSPHMAAFLGSIGDLGITGSSIDQYEGATKTNIM